jgi:hypothetical protein
VRFTSTIHQTILAADARRINKITAILGVNDESEVGQIFTEVFK